MTDSLEQRLVLGVVVPVHDEQERLGDCLAALRAAADDVADRARVAVVAVLDDCSDRSELIVRRHRVGIVRIQARNVGRARQAGCAALLARDRPAVSWLASTDADSQVPTNWFEAHLDALDAGCDAIAGTVRVDDWTLHPPATEQWFQQVYERPDAAMVDPAHGHVHGANLGVRPASYRLVGGFPPLTTGEDVALISRLGRTGHHIRRTRAVPVLTSARLTGRAPHGFAAYLVQAPHLSAPAPRLISREAS